MTFGLKIIAFFMSIITFFIPLFSNKNAVKYSYPENPIVEKEEKDITDYAFKANDIAVSVNGKNSNDGSESAPVATVQRARELAKEKRADGVTDDITVWISGGVYRFDESMKTVRCAQVLSTEITRQDI